MVIKTLLKLVILIPTLKILKWCTEDLICLFGLDVVSPLVLQEYLVIWIYWIRVGIKHSQRF